MPYIYSQAEELEKKPSVGNKQCVDLIKILAKAPATIAWKEGDMVRGNSLLATGTAIATFSDGKYANRSSGNHAAFYIGQDVTGIWVVDQWLTAKHIQKRKPYSKCLIFRC